MKHHCGVFGVYNCAEASRLCYLGLYALQHRGQESSGIVSLDDNSFYVSKGMGLVSDVFNEKNLSYLKGNIAIGHVRYSTTGSSTANNIQPIYSKTSKGKLAVGHNGNLTNAFEIYKKLEEQGALFQTTIDSEIILHLASRSKGKNIIDCFKDTLSQIEGAYSLVIMGEKFLMGARDPFGFRPLVLGKYQNGYILSSETCAFDLIGAEYIREIEPGEIVLINKEGIHSYYTPVIASPKMCVFEHIYFARPDSLLFGESVYEIRKNLGRQLAKEHPIHADLVMAIPDSGNSAALGYSEEAKIPFEFGMTRNHYVGRTFIHPKKKIRNLNVKVKLNPIKSVLKNKKVIVVDDSLVRGTTSKQRIAAIRKAGAKEIHVRISAPPIISPCHYGIDMPNKDQLIAANKSIEEIRSHIGADSLGYISKKGLLNSLHQYPKENYCTACFTGKYPIKVKKKGKLKFEKSRKIKHFEK